MKHLKFIAAAALVGVTYLTTVAWTADQQPRERKIYFETDDYNEVSRIKDLLNDQQLKQVEALKVRRIKIRLEITVRPDSPKGPVIVILGGGV